MKSFARNGRYKLPFGNWQSKLRLVWLSPNIHSRNYPFYLWYVRITIKCRLWSFLNVLVRNTVLREKRSKDRGRLGNETEAKKRIVADVSRADRSTSRLCRAPTILRYSRWSPRSCTGHRPCGARGRAWTSLLTKNGFTSLYGLRNRMNYLSRHFTKAFRYYTIFGRQEQASAAVLFDSSAEAVQLPGASASVLRATRCLRRT